jgi:hypothetical protein
MADGNAGADIDRSGSVDGVPHNFGQFASVAGSVYILSSANGPSPGFDGNRAVRVQLRMHRRIHATVHALEAPYSATPPSLTKRDAVGDTVRSGTRQSGHGSADIRSVRLSRPDPWTLRVVVDTVASLRVESYVTFRYVAHHRGRRGRADCSERSRKSVHLRRLHEYADPLHE